MDHAPATSRKMLEHWMEWERGDTPPGRVLANLKTDGLADVLRRLAADDS